MITIVTPPDNNVSDDFKLLLAGLTPEQTNIISSVLIEYEDKDIMVYMCDNSKVEWLLDKKLKADMIIFNAEHEDQNIVGYLAAQPNSWYFGNLLSLNLINKRVIYNVSDFTDLLRRIINTHG